MDFSDEEFGKLIDDSTICVEENAATTSAKKRKKPHVTSTWTNESVHDLIGAVETYNCIWEYSSSEYKDRQKREAAWQDIADKFPNHGVEGCKAKWANVKTFFLNVKKKLKSKSGQGAVLSQPHWPFWTAMQFYYQHDRAKTTRSVSTFEVSEESSSTTFSAAKQNNNAVAQRLSPDVVMQRALKFLDADVDKWHGVGMYLALQMREIAQRNVKAANKLHSELVKKAMEAMLEEDESNH